MGFFRVLSPIKPTERGLAFVKTETFLRTCQLVAREALAAGKTWEEVDVVLRHVTVKELLPHRKYTEDEVADFYRSNWRVIDGAWLPAVQKMKEDWCRMAADPAGFIKAFAASQLQ